LKFLDEFPARLEEFQIRRTTEMMPKAARERVAKPPAGTALARAAWECLPGHVRLGEVRK
jgi:hypothetical protein